jgi:type VI secretion system ImpC/EvpB family protein
MDPHVVGSTPASGVSSRGGSPGAIPAGLALDQFLAEPSPVKAVALWVGQSARSQGKLTRDQVTQLLSRDIARLDVLLNRQVNAILHHPAFQRLEASWRGLRWLVEQVPEEVAIKVRVLDLTWRELTRDLEKALEFDQSQLFRKVYGEEFGTPGGEPFGVLLGDYAIWPRPGPDHATDDIEALLRISSVAAAAFAPFIAAVHPSMFELDSFAELERPLDLARSFERIDYLKWRAFRRSEDARFVGLTLPRVLARLPYRFDAGRVDAFPFREEVEAASRGGYLWGTPVYAFGSTLVRAFAESGWFASIRGAPGGGLVTGLPVHCCGTDRFGVAPKCSTDVMITDAQEKELGELGFIPLCHCPDTDLAAFYGNQSVQRPATFDELAATMNARLSAMLQYMLCVSRFAHYVKVIARDRVGSLATAGECEDYLQRWLTKYVTTDDAAGPDTKARYPLREARTQVKELPGKPGSYFCVVHLRPHFQLEQVTTSVRLATQLTPGSAR